MITINHSILAVVVILSVIEITDIFIVVVNILKYCLCFSLLLNDGTYNSCQYILLFNVFKKKMYFNSTDF